jgi:hypothetical protein
MLTLDGELPRLLPTVGPKGAPLTFPRREG